MDGEDTADHRAPEDFFRKYGNLLSVELSEKIDTTLKVYLYFNIRLLPEA